METENQPTNPEVEENLDLPQVVEGEEETTDWKAEATKLREKAIAQRERTKVLKQKLAEKEVEAKKVSKTFEKKKSDELDYAQKAYLRSSGIEPNEFDFVNKQIQESGMELEKILENGYFQHQLKEHRDAKAVLKATPSGNNRGSGESSKNSVDYWLNKGELPEDPKLRAEVVSERYNREKSSQGFVKK